MKKTLPAALVALAMTTPAALASETPSVAPDVADMPQVLRDIGLQVEGRRNDDDGIVEVWGTLPDGTRVEVHYSQRGVEDIEVRGRHATLPLEIIDNFVTEAAEIYPVLSHITRLTQIDQDDDGEVEMEGWTVDGRKVKAEFDRSGRLLDFERN
ncbi:hypothetical protein DLJ53_01365 [Acuticoccus sediminis]|uniref:PepSY domain-containing protein n=1 Tax=Acuticoccus sediminis TaxID=2184697 RepID=A0A8B2NWI3_9HYPH|nr:PepSY domain-containing protein [Acuticoccus sediminis]RAI03201.1 hypothetical protein DLJ53_01365 [Acuticoccus sediminis]